jgi:putative glutamine amidotransferase
MTDTTFAPSRPVCRAARRPVIGVTTQTLHAIAGHPRGAARELGDEPALLPRGRRPRRRAVDDPAPARRPRHAAAIYERLDGLLIPGGVDMDPASYGEEILPETGRLDPPRDCVELQLVKWAWEDGMPVLGLCRGAQVINVRRGGSLWQDIPTQWKNPRGGETLMHDCYPTKGFARTHHAHEVELGADTRLHAAMPRPSVPVNSMHHQSVKRVGDGLIVSAVAPDGVVEAVEAAGDRFMVGVQWHPEVFEVHDPYTRHLFRDFMGAAETFAHAA